ncbi:MAG: response regulator transcription factor [Chloroflexi bacterium AL-W]|nr:response regulator transcription factor [Chloroflexi bacterium AL-N1]NOK69128.1 response regulator transcription factor [Chloroflexi bacterium AL-N10]NOK77111.1 response regulator transcription factor [Chloroflexi bacterium AL-N5]NOK83756.1 response regulator transcription factor [Chloroflexi bacterium AL-W]NOK90966.1 response regulator transcription factor [Chloroflexi bacterium AL-N15]
MSAMRVMLVEDHALVRAGIRSLLEKLPDLEVVAEAGDGRTALSLIAQHQPDVVLMDIKMAGLNGLEATSRIVRDLPGVRVVILSMYANEEYVIQALRVGASGYLLKDAGTAELEVAVRAAARGETYLSPAISRRMIQDYLQVVGGEGGALEQLTPRQREVLQLVAEGHSVKEIAQILQISVKTVETHRAQLMERLDIHDVAGLVRYAIRVGLVASDE